MTDATPDTGTEPTTTEPDDTPTEDHAAEIAKWKAAARKHEERAKQNATAAKELEALKAQTMTETEKAVAAAREEGRALAFAETAGLLVDAQVRIAATGRLEDDAIDSLLDGLDRSKFINEHGSVDAEKVAALVGRIAPQAPNGFPTTPDLGQGTRSTTPLGSDPLLDALKSTLGL